MSNRDNTNVLRLFYLLAKSLGSLLCLLILVFIIYLFLTTIYQENRSKIKQQNIEREMREMMGAESGQTLDKCACQKMSDAAE